MSRSENTFSPGRGSPKPEGTPEPANLSMSNPVASATSARSYTGVGDEQPVDGEQPHEPVASAQRISSR